ncbi:hypothetical protein Barb7_03121 [Bacteroidales bacterium Barb7]|nr:hypothetical protein Barb7_03121 [Bacteroidales bacterium Barb7]
MQYIGGRRNGIASKEKPQPRLFGSGYQSVGKSLVAVHIRVETRCGLLALDAVGRYACVNVVSVIVSVGKHLDISLHDARLFRKLAFQQMYRAFQRAFKKPADQAQRKHILAAESRFIVQTKFRQAFLHH